MAVLKGPRYMAVPYCGSPETGLYNRLQVHESKAVPNQYFFEKLKCLLFYLNIFKLIIFFTSLKTKSHLKKKKLGAKFIIFEGF